METMVARFRVRWVKRFDGGRVVGYLVPAYPDPGDETADATEALMQDVAFEANESTFGVETCDNDGGFVLGFDKTPPEPGDYVELVLRTAPPWVKEVMLDV